MGNIVFNGISSKDIGLEVETFPEYQTPQKVLDVISVPGRNGDLVVDTGTYRNVTRPYKVSIATFGKDTYSQKMSKVAEWLYSPVGYARLEDSYDEAYFRYAYYGDAVTFENLFDEAGRATLQFICKPERYLKSGENPILFTAAGTIQNETKNPAFPLLNVTTDDTAGSIMIGEYNIALKAGIGEHVIIDCELEDAYYGEENKNNYIDLNGEEFPRIDPGLRAIAFTGGVQSVEVIPRWWVI